MADGRRIYHKAWCGGGGWGDDVHVCKSARGSREAPGVMCVPLSQSLEADGGDIYHKAGCGRGGAWGFRGVNLCACRCRRAYEADGGAGIRLAYHNAALWCVAHGGRGAWPGPARWALGCRWVGCSEGVPLSQSLV